MNSLNLILLGIGLVALVIALMVLILNVMKGTFKTSLGLVSLLLVGATFLIVGFVIDVPGSVEKMPPSVDNAVNNEVASNNINSNEVQSNESAVTAVINEDLIITGSDPLEIAKALVEHEMANQEGLSSWEITENSLTSDTNVFNISDYDKPVGDMRIVWIEGNVNATANDGTSGNVGYSLELYQMSEQDPNWYVGNHWGVLIDLAVTKTPNYQEDERYFSDSDQLIIDEENGGLSSVNVPEYGESFEEANPDKVTTAKDLIGAWHWNEYDDFYMILRNDYTYSYIEKNAGFYSEGTYTVDEVENGYKVTVHYTTGENDSVMTIKLINKNQLVGNEEGYSWQAKKVNLDEVEGILKSLK